MPPFGEFSRRQRVVGQDRRSFSDRGGSVRLEPGVPDLPIPSGPDFPVFHRKYGYRVYRAVRMLWWE